MKRVLTPTDILSLEDYARVRNEKRRLMIERKKNRRVQVGPYALFTFENYDTMWLQVQEMLRIEKGGEAQLADELRAYNPLIPNGQELVATVMFEIEDPVKRAVLLGELGGVENRMEFQIGGDSVKGQPEQDLDYSSAEGKASSVQFVHFRFSLAQIKAFRDPETDVILAINHPAYSHQTLLSEVLCQELAGDFDLTP